MAKTAKKTAKKVSKKTAKKAAKKSVLTHGEFALAELKQNGALTAPKLAKKRGISTQHARDVIYGLLETGHAVRVERGIYKAA
jgi:ribosomal protein S25